jgi:hypothetical protein
LIGAARALFAPGSRRAEIVRIHDRHRRHSHCRARSLSIESRGLHATACDEFPESPFRIGATMPRYYITLPNPSTARGSDPALSFTAHGADEFAEQLKSALTGTGLFDRWRAKQEDPDDVPDAMATTDPAATVRGEQSDLRIDLIVTTTLPSEVLRQRLRLLAGSGWQLRDVK